VFHADWPSVVSFSALQLDQIAWIRAHAAVQRLIELFMRRLTRSVDGGRAPGCVNGLALARPQTAAGKWPIQPAEPLFFRGGARCDRWRPDMSAALVFWPLFPLADRFVSANHFPR